MFTAKQALRFNIAGYAEVTGTPYKELAKAVGASQQSFSSKVRESRFDIEEIVKIAKRLNDNKYGIRLNYKDLMKGADRL